VKIDEYDGEEILRQIWTRMTQLESLDLWGGIHTNESMDSLLTGISSHVLHEIKDVVNNLDKISSEVERSEKILELRNQHCQLPSIVNLTKLKSLGLFLDHKGEREDMWGRDWWDWKYVTDFTGYLALYSIKTLTNLEIRYSDCGYHYCGQMTDTCIDILAKDMGLKSKYEVISCGFTGECPSWI